MRKAIILTIFMAHVVSLKAQNNGMQEVLDKLNAGESVENMVINLSDVNFSTGNAELGPVATAYLEQVVTLLQIAPNIDLFIKGFADNTGSDELNLQLSLQRAQSVEKFFRQREIPDERLSTEGYGSSNPVASNETAEGRGFNRRVEMEVLKREEAKTIQDIIVLRNRNRIGSRVLDFNDANIRYQQFTSEDTLLIKTYRVDTILFSDGTIKVFRREEPKAEKFDLKKWWVKNVHIFKESASFHKGNFVTSFGIAPNNNIGIRARDHQMDLPPVLLIAELPIGYNLGVGISAGTMGWSKPETPEINYMYYALGLRLAYHFNLGEKLDLYAGGAVTGRMGTVTNGEIMLRRQKVSVALLLGARYYFNNTLGLFAEIGDENVAYAKAGLAVKFGK